MNDTISDQTRVPISMVRIIIGCLIGIFGLCVGAIRWAYAIDAGLSSVNDKLDQANQRIGAVVVELKELNNDAWTIQDMRAWAENLSDRNPSLSIPKVKSDR